MPQHGHLVDVEHTEQVAHAVGVGGHRVVGPRLIGLPVSEQVRGDHREIAGQSAVDGLPGQRVVADPVDQQQSRAGARDPVGPLVAVDHVKTQLRGRVDDVDGCRIEELFDLAKSHGHPWIQAGVSPAVERS